MGDSLDESPMVGINADLKRRIMMSVTGEGDDAPPLRLGPGEHGPNHPDEPMGDGVGANGIDEIGEGPEPGIDGPELLEPTPPGVDELGYTLVPFTCRKCSVVDHAPRHTVEIYERRGIHCLPCREPWRWKWKLDPDTGQRFLYPVPGGGKPRARLGEDERRHLENKATELLDGRMRREYLRVAILKMQAELTTLEPRLVELTLAEVPRAQAAVEAIELDPNLELRQQAADLAHDINLAIAGVAKKTDQIKRHVRR